MILFKTFGIAVRALRRNTLRTLLTMLGIIFGVAAVIAMVSLGNGARAQLEASIATLGQNVITVLSGTVSRGGFRMAFGSAGTLTQDDFDSIRKEIPGVNGASPEVRNFAQLAAGNQNINSQIMGVGADYLDVRSWACGEGESFTESDVRTANKVALIGKTTAETLFGDEDPIGQIIRVKNAPFRIVGLLSPKGTDMWGRDQDDVLLVPYTSAMKRLTGDLTFRSLMIQASTPQIVTTLTNQITDLLRQRHKISAGKDDDFIVRTQQDITEFADSQARTTRQLLFYVALISLIVGGIGVMNIMLVSVTERTREIGVRLAVGARSRDILLQFLTEAVTLSVIGGALGIAFGVACSRLVTQQLGWATLTSTGSIILSFGVSAAIGIFFGFYPSLKASQLDPIDALRYE